MPETSLIFPAQEYRGRVARVQAAMAAAGAEALLLTMPEDIFYITGFLTRFWESPARPWFVIVPAKGDPVAVIPAIGVDLMSRTWITHIRSWPAPDPRDDGVSLLAETLCDLVPENGTIATPMGAETHLHAPLGHYDAVKRLLGQRRIIDGTHLIQSVREIKSEAEIAKIRETCGIADRAFARVPEFAREGAPLDQVFRDFQIALLQEGADWVSYVAGGAGQGGYTDVISPAAAQPLQAGDILMLDTGAVKDGYFCDFDRNFAIGTPTDTLRRAQEALWQATQSVLQTLRPGHLACDVHRMLDDALRASGVTTGGGRLGHGLGIALTEWPSFTPLDTTLLRAGMVLTLEPGVDLGQGRILVHEENIVLREDGPELLSTRAPQEMVIL
ncbi:MAG: Xaa-Pro peptidase family protein [Pseudomonadota bacterium]|nr:Xaa-Pro peptidase family protein [Pseudomonadota bacterium]MEE3070727.1 Xaa-Pro peptidase family protein [Pseudomonadota bacterium]